MLYIVILIFIGIVLAEYFCGVQTKVNYEVIPSVIYTHPEVAWCGKTEEQLSFGSFRKSIFPFVANSRAKTISNFN